MATHSSIHAWEIPWTEEPSGLSQTRLGGLTTTNSLVQTSEVGQQASNPTSDLAWTLPGLHVCLAGTPTCTSKSIGTLEKKGSGT